MATALISGVFSVVGKALAPLKDGLLKDWAASVELGDNVEALELELLSAKAVLEHTVGKEIADNSAFRALLVRLQDLGYDAEDVLDELDYFRIQDQLHGTSAAADTHAKGFVRNMALHAKAVGKQIICLPACLSPGAKATHHHQEVNGGKAKRAFCCNISHTVIGKCVPCSSSPTPSVHDDNFDDDEPTKLRFNRVDASKRMKLIVEQLRLVQKKVSGIIAALGPSWSTAPNIAQSRLITSSDPTESRLYGRELMMSSIIHDITEGKHSAGLLTVIPIVGPGGIGKTTLAQHIYHNEKVQKHFDVKLKLLWIGHCSKLNLRSSYSSSCFPFPNSLDRLEEQEILLFVNSLNMITFDSCNSLQYLPARLHRLPNLKILEIKHCKAIQMLPKDSLPSSLQELEIEDCPEIRSLPEDGLPSSLRRLHIFYCPAIQSLPKVDDLPNSLRELDIKRCGNEELKRQCRGLIGTIPIVKTD
nr:unnamed protein product [Digitaria exilis]